MKKKKEDIFKDYVPETVEYDPEVDGGEEHMERDEHLATKEKLYNIINKRKKDNRGDRRVRR